MKINPGTAKILFILCLFSIRVSAEDPAQLIKRVEKAVRDAKTVKIEFQELFVWTMTEEQTAMQGTLWMMGDDRFRIETEDQILVSDGETLWTYSKPAHRVLIDKLSESSEALLPRQLLLTYTEGYRATACPDEEIDGTSCQVLAFEDDEGQSFYAKWKIWINAQTYFPKKLMQEDLNGNQNIYVLNSVESGMKIDPKMFTFKIPDGAEVIEM